MHILIMLPIDWSEQLLPKQNLQKRIRQLVHSKSQAKASCNFIPLRTPYLATSSIRIIGMDKNKKSRHSRYVQKRAKVQTNRILDRITYNPKKHKQKVTRSLRQKLQKNRLPDPEPIRPTTTMKFGSFNINGLDLETSWAVEEIVKKHDFDVSSNKSN